MKVLHIIPAYKPAYGYGGPTESVSRLCEGLAAVGHSVDVYTTTANGDNELDVPVGIAVDVDGVNVTYFKRITGDHTHISPLLWLALLRSAKTYDIIHLHSWWSILMVIAAPLALISNRKIIIAPRGMLSDYVFNATKSIYKKILHNAIGRLTLKKCVLHATAQSEYDDCKRLIPEWKGFILPNILSLPDVKVVENKNPCFTLIFMSRIHHKKGLEKLFEAISQIQFDLKLIIAGEGDEGYVSELSELAAARKIEKKINWIGWVNREEKFTELNKADLLVLTSLNENFANVVVESLYMGTAVLISKEVGLAEFVESENLGWTCSLNVDDIVRKLNNAYHDKNKLLRIRKTGRAAIERTFSEKVLIEMYAQAYLDIDDADLRN